MRATGLGRTIGRVGAWALQVELLLLAGVVVSLALAGGLSLREPRLSKAGRWFCFDARNNAYRVREMRAPGRRQLTVSRDYSVAPWRPVPGYLRIPDGFGKTEVTVIDGWPWPCL